MTFFKIILLIFFGMEAQGKELILLTYFEPFAGREVNRSELMAKYFKNISNLGYTKFQIEICKLSVVYDRGLEETKNCLAKLEAKPSYIISLGEGDCNVNLELSAINMDDSYAADNEGNIREFQIISENMPHKINFTLPVGNIVDSVSNKYSKYFKVDSFMGNYVCNNAGFQLGTSPEINQQPYGFIHVPPASCGKKVKNASYSILYEILNSLN